MPTYDSVEAYLKAWPADVSERLLLLRKLVVEIRPDAEERISYGSPSYHDDAGRIAFFSAYKKHISFYIDEQILLAHSPQLFDYKLGKGTLQCLHSQEMPVDQIRSMLIATKA